MPTEVTADGAIGLTLGQESGPVGLGINGSIGLGLHQKAQGAKVIPRTGHRRSGPGMGTGWLGRFRLGDEVPLAIQLPAWPDADPTAILSLEGTPVLTVTLAAQGPPVGRFALPFALGPAMAGGTYTVAYAWAISGVSGLSLDRFEVVAGGDGGGAVISLHAFDRPEARFVVAHLSSGRLVYGRGPGV